MLARESELSAADMRRTNATFPKIRLTSAATNPDGRAGSPLPAAVANRTLRYARTARTECRALPFHICREWLFIGRLKALSITSLFKTFLSPPVGGYGKMIS